MTMIFSAVLCGNHKHKTTMVFGHTGVEENEIRKTDCDKFGPCAVGI